jgi:phosphatidate phosphatase APP1
VSRTWTGPPTLQRRWKTDDRIFFFPSIGIPVDEGWQVEVHAWCYRLRSHRVVIPLVRKALGFERTRLSTSEKQTFAERARWMFADNRRDHAIAVAAAGEVFTLGKTRPNGRLRASILLKAHIESDGKPCEVSTTVKSSSVPTRLDIHFLAPDGLSVISDIDDTIRISHVRKKGALLRGTFLEPFRAVDGMADVFRAWSLCGAQFHYLSATPWQLYVPIAAFVDAHGFPKGTFHLRDFRWKDRTIFNVLASPDRYKRRTIEPLLRQLPQRRFVLVGDSGQRDPEVFGELARCYPRQVQRIFIRDVGRSTPSRYRTAFAGLPRAMWMVFSDPGTLPVTLAQTGCV